MWTWPKVEEIRCQQGHAQVSRFLLCFSRIGKVAVLILEYVSQSMNLVPVILTVMKLLGKLVLKDICHSLSLRLLPATVCLQSHYSLG